MHTAAHTLKLIGFRICPFVERTRIVLNEKQIDCEQVIVDIRNKPQWFLDLVPTGKVPALQVDDTVIFESSVINEFFDELSGPSLHPKNLVTKAQNRAWIEWATGIMIDAYNMSIVPNQATLQDHKNNLLARLPLLEQQLTQAPFFNGNDFCMIDIAYAPQFKRFESLKRTYGIDILNGFPKIQAWADAVLAQESVIKGFATNFDDEIEQLLRLKGSCLIKQAN